MRAPTAQHPGVRVVVRLLLAAAGLLALLVLAGLLVTRLEPGSDVAEQDTAVVEWLAGERTPALNAASGTAAELGNTLVVLGVGLATALVAAVLRRWRVVLVLAVALVGELVLFLTTTAVIDRPRPPVPHLDAQLPPTSSFPSGHTAASICLYGGIAALVLAATRAWWRWLVLAVAVALVASVALARLYRGAHFPTDVLGSVLFAVPWLLVVLRVLPGAGQSCTPPPGDSSSNSSTRSTRCSG
jgi:membrane-associated phospholipid phosphatase